MTRIELNEKYKDLKKIDVDYKKKLGMAQQEILDIENDIYLVKEIISKEETPDVEIKECLKKIREFEEELTVKKIKLERIERSKPVSLEEAFEEFKIIYFNKVFISDLRDLNEKISLEWNNLIGVLVEKQNKIKELEKTIRTVRTIEESEMYSLTTKGLFENIEYGEQSRVEYYRKKPLNNFNNISLKVESLKKEILNTLNDTSKMKIYDAETMPEPREKN